MISDQKWTVTLDGDVVEAIDGSVTLDDSWSPFIQARVTIPTPAGGAPDPRGTTKYASMSMSQRFGSFSNTADLTDLFAAGTTADITTEWASLLTSDITAAVLASAWNATHVDATSLELESLVIRSREVSADGTTTLTLASVEAVLQDQIHPPDYTDITLTATPGAAFPIFVYDVYKTTSAENGLPMSMQQLLGGIPDPYDVEVPLGEDLDKLQDVFTPGANIFDWYETRLQAEGLHLWGDEQGRLRITAPQQSRAGTITLTRVVDATDTIDRDSETYAEGVVLQFQSNPDHPDWEIYAASIASVSGKGVLVQVASPTPIDGVTPPDLPDDWRTRFLSRGRTLTATAMSNFSARPGMTLAVDVPNIDPLDGVVDAVTFDLATARMTLTGRSLSEA